MCFNFLFEFNTNFAVVIVQCCFVCSATSKDYFPFQYYSHCIYDDLSHSITETHYFIILCTKIYYLQLEITHASGIHKQMKILHNFFLFSIFIHFPYATVCGCLCICIICGVLVCMSGGDTPQ